MKKPATLVKSHFLMSTRKMRKLPMRMSCTFAVMGHTLLVQILQISLALMLPSTSEKLSADIISNAQESKDGEDTTGIQRLLTQQHTGSD